MSLGEIPVASNLRAYYKLENENDSTSNAFTLTNYSTVSFPQARFNKGADFGSSGTTKALQTTSNVLGSSGSSYEVCFWYKLNNTSSANTPARFFTSQSSGAGGFTLFCGYSISAGNITISATLDLSTTDSTASITDTADSNWHWVRVAVDSGNGVTLRYDANRKVNGATGSGSKVVPASTLFTVGNGGGRTTSGWVTMDEVFCKKDSFFGQGDYQRYYTQAKGRFCI